MVANEVYTLVDLDAANRLEQCEECRYWSFETRSRSTKVVAFGAILLLTVNTPP